QGIWAVGFRDTRPWETFVKEFLHGFNGLEGTSYLRFNFDPRAADHGGAHRAHQLQSAPQGMPHPRQAAFVLPHAQPHHRALGSGEGLRSEEHTSELQSLRHLVCRLLLEKKKKKIKK